MSNTFMDTSPKRLIRISWETDAALLPRCDPDELKLSLDLHLN